jgi:hypothetical protein
MSATTWTLAHGACFLLVACSPSARVADGEWSLSSASCPSRVVPAADEPVEPGPVVERQLTTEQPNGFYVLGGALVRDSTRLGAEAAIFEEPGSFCELLRTLAWHGPTDVDFRRYFVFAFSGADDPGCYVPTEPSALVLDADGVLTPRLVHPYLVCSIAARAPQGAESLLRVLAVSRDGVPPWGFRHRRNDGTLETFRLHHPLGRLPPQLPGDEPILRPSADTVQATTALPEAGDAALTRLHDGTFVWVVHHREGGVSVLDARSTYGIYQDLPGVRTFVFWERLTRRFQRIYDEYGVARWHPNLSRYEADIDETGLIVRIGRAGPPVRRKLMVPIGDGSADGTRAYRVLQRFEALSIDQALRAADGTTVLIDASLHVSRDRPPCVAPSDAAKCDAGSPVPVGLEHLRAMPQAPPGAPVIARVIRGRLYDLTVMGL